MLADARIVHELPGRLRLRFEARRGDEVFFTRLSSELRQCPGILDVRPNPVTASLLILHATDTQAIGRYAREHGLFGMGPAARAEVQAQLRAGMAQLNRTAQALTGASMNMDALLVIVLTALAIHQMVEGNIMVPAASLLWYAYNAARMSASGGTPWQGVQPAASSQVGGTTQAQGQQNTPAPVAGQAAGHPTGRTTRRKSRKEMHHDGS